MPQFDTIVATTELEAVNTILSVIGENPITDLDAAITAGETDIQMIVNRVRTIQREMLNHGWRFNTEFGVRIAIDGSDQFVVPSSLLRFEVTDRADQIGHRPEKEDDGTLPKTDLLDITMRAGVFYDRLRSVDTFTGDFARDQIFIDGVYAVDFTDMPETARHFVVTRAGREVAQHLLGAQDVVGYTDDDVVSAWRNLKEDQQDDKELNMLDNGIALRIFGSRPQGIAGF